MDRDPYILLIDTATTVCSVALAAAGRVLSCLEDDEPNVHASKLTPLIGQLMEQAQLKYEDLSAVAVAKGPGSYTGLRIGVSVAKGLCYAADLPLIGVDTLLSLAGGFLDRYPHLVPDTGAADETFLCPMIDARRMEVYCAVYKVREGLPVELRPTQALVIDETSFDFLDQGQRLLLFGTGADKFADLFRGHKQFHVYPGFASSAKALAAPAFDAYSKQDYVDLAYFEPFYLKNFIPTTPKK